MMTLCDQITFKNENCFHVIKNVDKYVNNLLLGYIIIYTVPFIYVTLNEIVWFVSHTSYHDQ